MNRLAQESSPYLLQHAHNPVDWYPWGEEALAKAKAENKLMLISIGYAACHWCHVMERESFEDEEVAAVMNEHFVCVKVDREERPDIDKIYMDAVMLLTGRGGWPLNAFALPDGRPVYGGTYFPKENWLSALSQLAEHMQQSPERVAAYADEITGAMLQYDQVAQAEAESKSLQLTDLEQIKKVWLNEMDLEWGGRNVNANKFPLPVNNTFMLRAAHLMRDYDLQKSVRTNLRRMALGGIYDQLGGGFSRYSVDKYWKVPHFEKMLYDNGQLVSLYAEAYQQQPDPLYASVIEQTINFVERELLSDEGGFYASLDADSEGVEGKFYVWQKAEVESLLGEDAKLFCDYYNIVNPGNWEETNVLFALETETEFARRWSLDPGELAEKLAKGRTILMQKRDERIRPGLDDKILCSWNAMMLKGCVDAWRVLGNETARILALRNVRFLKDKMWDAEAKQLYRNYKNGKRSIPAFLDDYAFLIDALLAAYQVFFDESYLEFADSLMETIKKRFHDPETGFFFYTSDQDRVLVRRKMESQDDVIPASNSVMAHNLFKMGLLFGRPEDIEAAKELLRHMKAPVIKTPTWHANWANLALTQLYPHYEVAISGRDLLQLRQNFVQFYFPNRIFAGSESKSELPILLNRHGEKSMIYVCQESQCQLPVTTVAEALKQMHISAE